MTSKKLFNIYVAVFLAIFLFPTIGKCEILVTKKTDGVQPITGSYQLQCWQLGVLVINEPRLNELNVIEGLSHKQLIFRQQRTDLKVRVFPLGEGTICLLKHIGGMDIVK